MRRRTVILYTALGIVAVALIMGLSISAIQRSEPQAICLQTTTMATPTQQQKAHGQVCRGGTPRQVGSSLPAQSHP